MNRAGVTLGSVVALLLPVSAGAQKYYTYAGQIGTKSALIAWGTAHSAGNTIGRTSASHGKAVLKIGPKTLQTEQNWAQVNGLEPDTDYNYAVTIDGRAAGEGSIRTDPEHTNQLAFIVIGDFGTGTSRQYKLAARMLTEFENRRRSGNPVRFVLTTGDNIYGDFNIGNLSLRPGDQDRDWEKKFFQPYEGLIRHIPFYPTLGNHDGNANENRGDLAAYLDNFFFPQREPARWYTFSFGGLADFFALDTTDNTAAGPPRPDYGPDSEQFHWLKQAFEQSRAPWKIPYYHHPAFNAGPRHPAYQDTLRHFLQLFESSGVKVVFNGHEHNFQYSKQNRTTGGICFVISGAGGELRPGNVMRNMDAANIAGWAAQNHFLVVEIVDRSMRITPVSFEPVVVKDSRGKRIQLPILIQLP